MKRSYPLLLMLLFATNVASAQSNTDLARADSLFKHHEQKEALAAYNDVLDENPDNLGALWHASLLYSRLGNQIEDNDQKKVYFNNAKKMAERALRVDSTNAHANFVMAVAMGRMALIVGARERVAASRDIKKYTDRALQADSSLAGAWHLLGRWNYEVANLNFAERLAANVLFGGIPDGASNEKAGKYIEKAIELKPDFVLYHYDLARVYDELDKEQQAITACEMALQKPTHTPADEETKDDCRQLIDDLK